MNLFRSVFAACLALSLIVSGNAHARFVSVDPVQANANTGENFNRYHYASNNPYRFVDPDGRQSRELNFETARSGYTPPPRSPDDWLGPAIGHALTGMVAAPVLGFGAGAILSRPAAASAFNAAVDFGMGDALGGASLATGGAMLFRVVSSPELSHIRGNGFTPSPNGFMVKQFVDNVDTAGALAQRFTADFNEPQYVVRAFAPKNVMDASDVRVISDLPGGMRTISVPNELLPQVKCLGVVDGC